MYSLWSQHLEQEQYDHERKKYFQSPGYKVIRWNMFWNNQVMNDIEGVLRAIIFAVDADLNSQ